MSRGRRQSTQTRTLNKKKVVITIGILLLIAGMIVCVVFRDKIMHIGNKKSSNSYTFESNADIQNKEKTMEDVLAEFGGEVIEQPKTDTYIVSKDGKEYTIYADGDIVEGRVSIWNGESKEPAADEVGNYNIYSAEELKWVADQVTSGQKNFSGTTITLRSNIDLGARVKEDGTWEGVQWTPIIGFLDELPKPENQQNTVNNQTQVAETQEEPKENLKRFAGLFDGNGLTIRGMYVDTDKRYQGLFGYSTGIIQNLTIRNSYVSGGLGTGAFVGLNGGTISNCVSIQTTVNGKDTKTGGIVGISMTSSTINQCSTSLGKVTGKNFVGGIAGYINNNASIAHCENMAEVTGENYTGGITGIAFFGVAMQENHNNGVVSGKDYVGGIAGYAQAQIEKSYNEKTVTGEKYVAGLVGVNFSMGNIATSYNKGNITGNSNVGGIAGTNNATISNCYNTETIKANEYRAGGICGQNATDSFINTSYNIGKIECDNNVGGITGGEFGTTTNAYYLNTILKDVENEQAKTEEDMKNNILTDLGAEFVVDAKQINNGYPILNWQNIEI